MESKVGANEDTKSTENSVSMTLGESHSGNFQNNITFQKQIITVYKNMRMESIKL